MKRIMLFGDRNTGKTCFLQQLLKETPEYHKRKGKVSLRGSSVEGDSVMFSSQTSSLELYSPTRGLEAGSLTLPIGKVKEIEEDSYINLQIWDTPGDATPEDYAGFNLEINGFVVFADLSKRNYDESVMRWHKQIETQLGIASNTKGQVSYSSLTLGNKSDILDKAGVVSARKILLEELRMLPGSHTYEEISLKQNPTQAINALKGYVAELCKDRPIELHNPRKQGTQDVSFAPSCHLSENCLLI